MKPLLLVGLVLVALGIAGLVAGHVSYTTREQVLKVGPIEATADEKHTIGIPDAAGVTALIAGIVLIVVGSRRA